LTASAGGEFAHSETVRSTLDNSVAGREPAPLQNISVGKTLAAKAAE